MNIVSTWFCYQPMISNHILAILSQLAMIECHTHTHASTYKYIHKPCYWRWNHLVQTLSISLTHNRIENRESAINTQTAHELRLSFSANMCEYILHKNTHNAHVPINILGLSRSCHKTNPNAHHTRFCAASAPKCVWPSDLKANFTLMFELCCC